VLVVLPIAFVVVLSPQLFVVNGEERPPANIAQLALLEDVEVRVLYGDVLRFKSGDDGVVQRGFVQRFSAA
jgi:hypothetical protein